MSKKLFVGNLPFEVNDADLSTVLAVAGTVASAKIVINKKTGRSKGYGFVEMETEEAALEAVKKFEGATLNERTLTVQIATVKQEVDATADGDAKTDGEANPHGERKAAAVITANNPQASDAGAGTPSEPAIADFTAHPGEGTSAN
jgi:RNA recognition motif-containing protein